MANTYSVQKMLKVNGRRQTWGIFRQRPNVSATVWEPVKEGAQSGYVTAAYARRVAEETFGIPAGYWERRQGRGSAWFIAAGE